MLMLVGAAIVIASVLGGYMMHGGQVLVLNQPSEFLIIGGASIGALVIGTPGKVLRGLLGQMKRVFSGGYRKDDYLELLVMLYQLFRAGAADRRDGARAAPRQSGAEPGAVEISEVPRAPRRGWRSSPIQRASSSSAASRRTISSS